MPWMYNIKRTWGDLLEVSQHPRSSVEVLSCLSERDVEPHHYGSVETIHRPLCVFNHCVWQCDALHTHEQTSTQSHLFSAYVKLWRRCRSNTVPGSQITMYGALCFLLITPCKMKNDLFCPFFFSLFDCVYIDITVYFLLFATKWPFIYIKRIYHSIYSIKLSCFFFILRDRTGCLAFVKFLNISCVYKLNGCQESSTLPASNCDTIYNHMVSISPSVMLV